MPARKIEPLVVYLIQIIFTAFDAAYIFGTHNGGAS